MGFVEMECQIGKVKFPSMTNGKHMKEVDTLHKMMTKMNEVR